jgi:hypothetical protein
MRASKLVLLWVALVSFACDGVQPGLDAGAAGQSDLAAGAAPVSKPTVTGCGGEAELACGLFDPNVDLYNKPCDAGLVSIRESCGCALEVANVCIVPKKCDRCRNRTRHRQIETIGYELGWVNWALKNQERQLALDEPLNWVSRIGAHNAFNATSDGYTLPSQFFSMADQLTLGARTLAIDIHMVRGRARLCHAGGDYPADDYCPLQTIPFVSGGGMRYYSNGIKEINTWLKVHHQEIVILEFENYVGTDDSEHLTEPLHRYLGSKLLLPNRAPLFVPEAPGDAAPDFLWPSRREMLAAGKRVFVFQQFSRPPGVVFHASYASRAYNQPFASIIPPASNPDYATCSWWPDFYNPDVDPMPIQDLEGYRWAKLEGNQLNPVGETRPIRVSDVRDATRCGFGIINMDFFSREPSIPPRLTTAHRQAAAVWSWLPGDRGQNGDCALLQASLVPLLQRSGWASKACGEQYAFACAPSRGLVDGKVGPRERLESDWTITTATGAWSEGEAACAAEFPGHVFAVPVSSYQNEALLEEMADTLEFDVWLNYTDQEREGHWLLAEVDQGDSAQPRANAGPDQQVECGNLVTLDGSASSDPDDDPLTYTWSGPFGVLTGVTVDVELGAGLHTIELLVTDGQGGSDVDSVAIEVVDTTPPTAELSLMPDKLWPPNHKMVEVSATLSAHDTCDDTPLRVELESVTSSQSGIRQGAGHHDPDIEGVDLGQPDLDFELRAERAGNAGARIYTVTYSIFDGADNVTERSATVTVPHSHSQF